MKFDFHNQGTAPAVPPSAATPARSFEEEVAQGAHLSVIALVDRLVEKAHAMRASDIHLDPGRGSVAVRLRIDGILQTVCELPLAVHQEVIARLKVLSGLRTDEHQAAQDGRFRVEVNGSPVDLRVSVVPTYYGENAVLRLLAEQGEEYSLELLGFTKENRDRVLASIKKPHGMILVTGPTGSGKTTTLYTIIKMLNSPDRSILTIEDPVEYSIAGINQIPVNARTGLSFATGLRSMLRQDPDIIMVGEIRDTETAGLAVNTALTGHLLLSTLHTNDAATTLPRLLDMKVEPYLIASTVNIAIGQRLVRRVCKRCTQPKPLSPAEKESLKDLVPQKMLEEKGAFGRGAGCEACGNTGYAGRVGIHEVIVVDQAVRDAILKKATAAQLRQIALSRGMTPMLLDGFEKARAGLTTIEEVLRMHYE
jgi:type IV pilus assembly protein PilB